MSTQADWEAKVAEIAAHVARELYGPGPHTEEQLSDAREAAEEAIYEWELASVEDIPPVAVDTLQRLLAEQHDLADAIEDERDDRRPA